MYMYAFILCICVFTYTYVSVPHVLRGQKRVTDLQGLEIKDDCELLCMYWELNLSLLQQLKVFISTKPFLYPFDTSISLAC